MYEISEHKRKVVEEKLRNAEMKYQQISHVNKEKENLLKSEESSLRSKIELMELDFKSQLTSREEKINELRRLNESMEFNLESLMIKNQELMVKRKELEERLRLVITSLRGSIDLIEDDTAAIIDSFDNVDEVDS